MEREMDEEMRFHLACRIEALERSGMSQEEAAHRARLEFGGMEGYKEECREALGLRLWDQLRGDLLYAFRTLNRRRWFTASALVPLALGIGACTVTFSVVDHILLRPFPFKDPSRLVFLYTQYRDHPKVMNSLPDLLDWQARSPAFESMGGFHATQFDVPGKPYPEQFMGMRATAGLFTTLGVRAQLGRVFLPEEQHEGRNHVVLLSDHLWRTRFHADPSVVGSTLRLSVNTKPAELYTVIGVLPPAIETAWPRHTELWSPQTVDGEEARMRRMRGMWVIGRLKPGVTAADAERSMRGVALELARQYPDSNRDIHGVSLVDFHEQLTGQQAGMFSILMGAVGLVLLISCANVANLMLAQGRDRANEFVLRASLGASRSRLLRQLLTEAVVLSILGGAGGAVLAWWGVALARAILPISLLRASEVRVDPRILLFTLLLSVATGIVAGLWPAFRTSRVRAWHGIWGAPRDEGCQRSRFRDTLVVAEIALGLVLLTGASLMIGSFVRLLHVDPGFDSRSLLAIQTALPRQEYGEANARRVAIEEICARVGSLPGVQAAGVSDFRPLGNTMHVIFRKAAGEQSEIRGMREIVGGDYFAAMNMRLLRGRLFTAQDGPSAPAVVLINEAAAKRGWPGEEPLGQQVVLALDEKKTPRVIVGVVADVHHSALDRPAEPAIYLPEAQDPSYLLDLVVRTQRGVSPEALIPAVRTQLASVNPALSAREAITMDKAIDSQIMRPRFLASVFGFFGFLALGLTATGVFGVMIYAARMRRHELGVRLALGATRGDLVRLLLRRGVWLSTLGLAIGAGCGLMVTRAMTKLLFGVQPRDPATFTASAAVIALVALAGTWLPAWRASRVDPMMTLRHE
jgi:putative ABC transport system permease protein